MQWRRLREADLAECLHIQPLRLADEIVGYTTVVETWKDLMERRAFSSCVVECLQPDGKYQIVGFGASVFVSKAFATSELNEMRPALNSRLMAAIVRGEHVIPGDHELCPKAPAQGLDMVLLGGSFVTTGVSPEVVRETQTILPSAFVEWFSGFYLNRLLFETVTDDEREFHESSGVWKTIARYPDQRALVMLTSQTAFSVSGSGAATLFSYRKPTLGLGDMEKELVAAALRGGTDDELAKRLHLSRSSIKKRWQSLFERVAETRPDLLPDDERDRAARGPQKRHHILSYLRTHPSEVRPFDWHGYE